MSSEPRVLIVEENDALRTVLFAVLRHQPLAVDTAASVPEALHRISGCEYALILIDVNLGAAGAGDFFNGFRRMRPGASTFIIAVRDPKRTACIDPSLVSAVLNKPLEIDTLAEVVRACAIAIPPPEDLLPCPPAESEIRDRIDRGSHLAN